MNLPALKRFDEPFAVRLVRAHAVILIFRPIADIGDIFRGFPSVHVHHIGKLNGGVLLDELLHDRLLKLGLHGFHHRVADNLPDDGHRRLRGRELDFLQIGHEQFGHVLPDQFFHLLARDAGHASRLVPVGDPFVDPRDARMMLVDRIFSRKAELGVDPEGDAGFSGFVGDHRDDRAFEQLRRVEDVVDFLALDQAVHMNAGAGHIEAGADERKIRRNSEADLPFKVVRDVGDGGRIDAVGVPVKTDIFHDQGFERRVSRALPQTQKRSVCRTAAVKPGGGRVDQGLVKIIVAVPFEEMAGHPGILDEGADQLLHAPGKGRPGIGHAEPHRVAEANLDIHPALLAELHQLYRKRDAETVDVPSGHIFEMAAGPDARAQDGFNDPEIVVQRLPPVLVQLEEDMVIGYRGQDPRFRQPRLFDQWDILGGGPNPAGNFGIAQTEVPALFHRLPVFGAVQEKFRLADDAVRPSEAAHQRIEIDDLLDAVGGPRLLAVTERRIRDEHIRRGVERHDLVVEIDPAHLIIGENILLQVRLRDVLQVKLPEPCMLVIENSPVLVPYSHIADLPSFSGLATRYLKMPGMTESVCP